MQPLRRNGMFAVNPVVGWGLVLFLVVAASWAVRVYGPPQAVAASAPAGEFSAERAFEHVQALADRPRPVGSEANARARAYLVSQLEGLGLQVEVQEAVLARSDVVVRVQNVAARRPGTSPSRAILLVSHYDTIMSGPGANDDTTGVATLLETARALQAGDPLQNDVIFLFTDNEEMHMWGAQAFRDQHPWMAEVGLVFNFEARGSRGPVLMFETTPGNGRLVAEFAQAVPYPFTSSLMYEIYRQLPNDTDFTIFKEAGIPGGGLAYIQDAAAYHTERDHAGNVSLSSLQHEGLYALGLAQHFGNLDLTDLPSPNAIYFDVLGRSLIHYPESWAAALMVGAIALYLGVAALGWKQGLLNLKGIGLGFGGLLLGGLLSAGAAALIWWLLTLVRPDFSPLRLMDVYHSEVFLLSFVCLTGALLTGLLAWVLSEDAAHPARRWTGLGTGALLVWLVLLVIASLWVPGASYLFLWPLVFALLGLGLCFATQPRPLVRAVILGVTALPGLGLVATQVLGFYVGLTIQAAYVPVILVALLLGLLVPHLAMALVGRSRGMLPLAALAAGVAALAAAYGLSLPGPEQPQPSVLSYGLDANAQAAYWLNTNMQLDEWNSQFLDGSETEAPAFYPLWTGQTVYQTSAPLADLAEPQVELLEDGYQDGVRRLRLHVTVRPEALTVAVYVLSDAVPLSVSVDGIQLENWHYLDYWAPPPEGFDLTLTFNVNEAVNIQVVDRSWGLEAIPGFTPRPPGFMAAPSHASDLVMVAKGFVFKAVK